MRRFERETGMLREFGRVSRGLKVVLPQLTDEDRHILEMFFFVPRRGNLERLCQEFGCEKSQLYRLRERALARFSVLWNAWEVGK